MFSSTPSYRVRGVKTMKTVLLPALVVVLFVCGLSVAFDVKLQGVANQKQPVVVIPVGGEIFKLKSEVIEKAKATKPPFKPDVVGSLIRHYRLDQKSEENPKLAFGSEEIKYWKNINLDKETLRLEFAARRLILDAADEQKVSIRDQKMLSEAARAVIPHLQDPPKIVSRPPETPKPNIPILICGSEQDATSEDLIRLAWEAFNANKGGMDQTNFQKALACAKITIARFSPDADEQQATRLQINECRKTPKPADKEAYFASNWALSDVSAAWFIRGQVFEKQSNCKDAKEAYQTIIAKYNCAYIWDPKGWFWNAARGADEGLKRLETINCKQ
jgi:hypothetical protein